MKLSNTNVLYGNKFAEVYMQGQEISNGGSIVFTLTEAGGCAGMDMLIPQTSSGNITTANISWRIPSNVEINRQTLTAGTDITDFDSSVVRGRIYNPVATTINVTGNYIIRW